MAKIKMVPGEDRPEETKLYEGELTKLLVELREREVALYTRTNYCLGEGIEILREAGFRVVESGEIFGLQSNDQNKIFFNGILHPHTFGREHYRGIFVYCQDSESHKHPNGIFLYTPFMTPWEKYGKGASYQIVLVAIWGDVPEEFIEKVIRCYVEGQLKRIEEMYEIHKGMRRPTDSQGRSWLRR